jgi:hypothetical protein
MALTGTRFSGSLSPGYFKRLKQEEAQRSLVGGQAISGETLEGLTGKALGDVYGERMASLQQSHRQKYGQMDLDIGERRLEIEEEAQKNKALGETISGVGNLVGMAIPFVGPAISGVSSLFGAGGTTMRMDAPFKSTPGMQYGTGSEWPSETRFMNMGSQLLFGSGGK